MTANLPPSLRYRHLWPDADRAEFAHHTADAVIRPETDDQLWQAIADLVGVKIPRAAVCPHHVAPFTALADAYFARSPVSVWWASRGFGGKSVLLAILVFMEAVTLGAWANLLGGSGEQSIRVHEYMNGNHPNLPNKFWKWAAAPRHLLATDPLKRETRLTNMGAIKTLMASQASVRGPHPQRLRLDEADEMSIELLDAALGQPMAARGILDQTVISSTWQNADGTMTEIFKRAAGRGWPVYQWCYKENMASPDGWLTAGDVERKRQTVTNAMWQVEYDNQEPSPEARAIQPEALALLFKKSLGEFGGREGEYIEIEPPLEDGEYAHGADWAKKNDYTVVVTLRIDVEPLRLVAFERLGRRPWPDMVGRLNTRIERYGGAAVHDGTGLGDVVDGYIEHEAESFIMVGRARSDLLSEYINSVESGEIEAPYIEYMVSEHKASVDDVYGAGHLPDTFSAMALARRSADRIPAYF